MTDANGVEMSNRWEEALTIRRWIIDMWNEMEAAEVISGGVSGVMSEGVSDGTS
jgi:hypothetical protein